MLVTLAILLVTVGGALSYSGYGESLRVLTTTDTESFTITYTRISVTTSTIWSVVRTGSSDTFHFGRHEIYGPCPGYEMRGPYPIDVLVHVSYSSDAPVDFWMIEAPPYKDPFQIFGCRPPESGPSILVSRLGSTSHEFTRNMSPNHWYHFGWVPSHGDGPVMIEYDIDLTYQSAFTMEMGYTAISSTQQILFPTQSVRVSSYPAGLGPVFFAGFTILVAGIALTTVVAAVKIMAAPNVVSARPCRQCGAKIPRGSKFCDKCGTAVPHDE